LMDSQQLNFFGSDRLAGIVWYTYSRL